MIICPCCGFRFEGDLRTGCEACGARAVGEPLPKPEHELPAYGRSLLLTLTGLAMVLGFLTQIIIALAKKGITFGFWDWVAAGETAAWRLKWIAIPITIVVLWAGHRIYNSMLQAPSRFVGVRMARRGLLASAGVSLLIAILIGITVPARIRQQRMASEAGDLAKLYTIARAQMEYQARYGTVATDTNDLLRDLPDPDGSIAAALSDIDANFYQPRADIAVIPSGKSRRLAGATIRNVSVNAPADDQPSAGLAFTNYDLRVPGPDKLFGTEDDLLIRDGVIWQVSEMKDPPTLVRAPVRSVRR